MPKGEFSVSDDYAAKSYWDKRFLTEDSFEWLQMWDDYGETLLKVLSSKFENKQKESVEILIVGCGNSDLGARLYNEGWINIINLDFSDIVIERMKNKYKETCPKMKWIEGDCMNMNFPHNRFLSLK